MCCLRIFEVERREKELWQVGKWLCYCLSSNRLEFALSGFRGKFWSSRGRKNLVEFDRAQNAVDAAGHRKKR